MHPDDSQGKGQSLHASKAAYVAVDDSNPTMPTTDTAHALSQPVSATSSGAQGNPVKKSRALFGMAMGAVLRPGTLPGVKPRKK